MIVNGYCTLADVLNDKTITSISDTDDGVITSLIESVSRYIDDSTGRWFYPRIQTRRHDWTSGRALRLTADLLSVTAVINGDGSTVASSDYTALPRDEPPYYVIRLKAGSDVTWQADAIGNTDAVINVQGVWGYHSRYADAWSAMTTLAASCTSTATTITLASGAGISAGSLLLIGAEYSAVDDAHGDVMTVRRGVNGSTSAAHNNGDAVSLWRVEASVAQACRLIVNTVYHNRYGNNPTGQVNITGAGVVITPQDVPGLARDVIERLALRGW